MRRMRRCDALSCTDTVNWYTRPTRLPDYTRP